MEKCAQNPQRDQAPPDGERSSARLLTDADVAEFQRIIGDHCGVTLDEAEAHTRANELLMLYRMLLGPIREDPEVSEDSTSSNLRNLPGQP